MNDDANESLRCPFDIDRFCIKHLFSVEWRQIAFISFHSVNFGWYTHTRARAFFCCSHRIQCIYLVWMLLISSTHRGWLPSKRCEEKKTYTRFYGVHTLLNSACWSNDGKKTRVFFWCFCEVISGSKKSVEYRIYFDNVEWRKKHWILSTDTSRIKWFDTVTSRSHCSMCTQHSILINDEKFQFLSSVTHAHSVNQNVRCTLMKKSSNILQMIYYCHLCVRGQPFFKRKRCRSFSKYFQQLFFSYRIFRILQSSEKLTMANKRSFEFLCNKSEKVENSRMKTSSLIIWLYLCSV